MAPAAAGEPAARTGVAAFDFDGTLVSRDSLIPFLARVAGRSAVARHLAATGWALALSLAGRGDRDAVKADVLARLLAGVPVEEIRRQGEAFAVVLEGRIRPSMRQRIAWHREHDHELIIVSASLTAYLEPLGRRLGFDAVLATSLEEGADGRLTGRLVGANVRGPEKAERVRRYVGDRSVELWAYGDSSGDTELLAMADHGFRVRGRRALQPAR